MVTRTNNRLKSQRKMYWATHIQDQFFDSEGLKRLIPFLADNESRGIEQILSGKRLYSSQHPCTDKQMDPISNAVSLCLTRPLCLIVNEIGVMPFQDRPHIVIAFSLMTSKQKDFVHACLQHRSEWKICNETVVFQRSRMPLHINPEIVLTCVCDLIMTAQKNDHSSNTKISLCNIILQRVQSHFPLDAFKQETINSFMQQYRTIVKSK